jgi:hypothetical protein
VPSLWSLCSSYYNAFKLCVVWCSFIQ